MMIVYEKQHPPSVPLDAPPGTKIVFHGVGGYPADQEQALSKLTVGETYTVQSISVGNWISYLRLEESPYSFNTVLFTPAASTEQNKPET